jgi:hypothetical protein
MAARAESRAILLRTAGRAAVRAERRMALRATMQVKPGEEWNAPLRLELRAPGTVSVLAPGAVSALAPVAAWAPGYPGA